jgi:ABC-type multidrug transport system permease subunit
MLNSIDVVLDIEKTDYVKMDGITYKFDHKAWNQVMIGLVVFNIIFIAFMVL